MKTSTLKNRTRQSVIFALSKVSLVIFATVLSFTSLYAVRPSCDPAEAYYATSDLTSVCQGNSVTLTVGGALNDSQEWAWYSNDCGLSYIGSGESITVTPETGTNYYFVRGEGGCGGIGNCVFISIEGRSNPELYVYSDYSDASYICEGAAVTFDYQIYNTPNSYSTQWYKNGSLVSESNQYYDNTLTNEDKVTLILNNYDEGCLGTTTSDPLSFNVIATTTPSINIYTDLTTICEGSSASFGVSSYSGEGSSPSSAWYKNGIFQEYNYNGYYVDNYIADGDYIQVALTNSDACVTETTVYSDPIYMTVKPYIYPEISITSSETTICEGSVVTFDATLYNEGTNYLITWYKNYNLIENENGTSYTDYSLMNNDVITAKILSYDQCAPIDPATSNEITMTVNPALYPSVSITSSVGDSPFCEGTTVYFEASVTDGGSNPTFQWHKTSDYTGTNGSTYSDSTLTNGEFVELIMTINDACASTSTVYSNAIYAQVKPKVNPVATISASSDTTICQGTYVQYVLNIDNPASDYSIYWTKNDTTIASGALDISYTPANNDVIKAVIYNNDMCTPSVVNSNKLKLKVLPNLTPEVSITANKTSPIYTGTQVIFTATPVNGGNAPSYQWLKDGFPVAASSNVYSDATLTSDNSIQVVMVSSYKCLSSPIVSSNPISLTVLPVGKQTQKITFPVQPACHIGDVFRKLDATSSSGLPITYTITLNSSFAYISNDTIFFRKVGTVKVTASQAGNGTYDAATSVTRYVTISGKDAQTITFNPLPTVTLSEKSFQLTATTTSNLPITYKSSNLSVAEISGDMVILKGVGTTTITASQGGNPYYLAATDVKNSLMVRKVAQTISFDPLPRKMVNDSAFKLLAVASSGLPITYTSSNTSVAIISNDSVIIVGGGTTNIKATQPGNETYSSNYVIQSLTVNKLTQTITFKTLPAYTVEAAPFTLSATSNSGLPITYSSTDPSIASVDGNQVTIISAGTCYIKATQAGNATYASATVQRLLTINSGATKLAAEESLDINSTNSSNGFITAYPNPVSGGQLFVTINNNDYSSAKIKLYDMQGNVVQQEEASYSNQLVVPINQTAGMYWLEVVTNSGLVKRVKIVVN